MLFFNRNVGIVCISVVIKLIKIRFFLEFKKKIKCVCVILMYKRSLIYFLLFM